ncbi:MAG: cytidine deaminase [Caldicoprobacterales bacterium]|nr:cytidine deaminase [Clostridiales bacterium]
MTDYRKLVDEALAAKAYAYAPYSGLHVGAALLCNDSEIFTGVNVENVSYGATNCAERTAVFKAVSEGKREFSAIAVTSDLDKPIYPCGICRQVLTEFKIPIVIVADRNGNYKIHRTEELIPNAFSEF